MNEDRVLLDDNQTILTQPKQQFSVFVRKEKNKDSKPEEVVLNSVEESRISEKEIEELNKPEIILPEVEVTTTLLSEDDQTLDDESGFSGTYALMMIVMFAMIGISFIGLLFM